jgi:Mn2+/Fe2+ NRAMP family transporter
LAHHARGNGRDPAVAELVSLSDEAQPRVKPGVVSRFLAVCGPGLLVMLADTDAGNVVTGAQAGAQWGYRLLPLLLLLIPVLYMVQELAVRLGIFTGSGHGALIRQNFGPVWAWISIAGLAVATAGTLVTEFTGIAGIGEIYGVPRGLTLPAAVAAVFAVAATGTYRRTERAALVIGLFELAFFIVACGAFRDGARIWHDSTDIPFGNSAFLYLGAAVIGAVFNPWMIFYQQSAVVHKGLTAADYNAARWETAGGAVLTQSITAAILLAAAASLGEHAGGPGLTSPGLTSPGLTSVGAISLALTPVLGSTAGRLVFSLGVLGAAMVAAVISSLALAYGVSEVVGQRHAAAGDPFKPRWARGLYAALLVGCAALVWGMPNLVRLNIGAQVLNALLLPMVIVFLMALSLKALPVKWRPSGWYLAVVLGSSFIICAAGVVGAFAWLL